jgi:predicted nuclease of restriction endonuclease-like (RecB) superfamily
MLSGISDTLKRTFYEQEAIKGCWTVKELDRQISSLCYERMGYSKNKAALQKHLADKNNPITAADIIRNPLSLEFLGLQQQDVFTETKLETAILNHLQQFLLELGTGFCFEARQKRVLIDNDYFKADLVFYHRILKCHVIVDLKIDRFRHEYASQLNLYLNYFKHEIMQPGDNPPVGLLLCTDYGETTVKYATEGLSQNLFVSKYKLQLPSEEEIKKFLTDNFAQIESL